MLTSMISTTDDPEITEMLKHHKQQTEEHERRLRERLDAMGAGTSTTKAVGGIGAAQKPRRRAGDGTEDRLQLGQVRGSHAGDAGRSGRVSTVSVW